LFKLIIAIVALHLLHIVLEWNKTDKKVAA
jgi:uncharacterized membrane protein YqhA